MEALIASDAEVMCAHFCLNPDQVYVDEEGRGTYKVTGRDLGNYLSWGDAVIAEVTFGELSEIHNKMETLLGREGAYLDGIYFCPHHPHKGYEGEIPELKFDCDCRKPKAGMLLKAAEELNIDLSRSWMVGDGENDILAGKAAGCRTALIGEGDFGQDMTVDSLLAFAERFAEEEGEK